MTSAADALAAGHAALHRHFPTEGGYLAPGKHDDPAVDCTLTIDTQLDDHQRAEIGTQFRRAARFLVRAAQVAMPIYDGLFTIATGPNAGTWRIRQVRALTGGNWECLVGADQQQRHTHPDAGWPAPLI